MEKKLPNKTSTRNDRRPPDIPTYVYVYLMQEPLGIGRIVLK